MKNLNMQMDLLEEVAAPGTGFVDGVIAGIIVVGAAAGLIAFT